MLIRIFHPLIYTFRARSKLDEMQKKKNPKTGKPQMFIRIFNPMWFHYIDTAFISAVHHFYTWLLAKATHKMQTFN